MRKETEGSVKIFGRATLVELSYMVEKISRISVLYSEASHREAFLSMMLIFLYKKPLRGLFQ